MRAPIDNPCRVDARAQHKATMFDDVWSKGICLGVIFAYLPPTVPIKHCKPVHWLESDRSKLTSGDHGISVRLLNALLHSTSIVSRLPRLVICKPTSSLASYKFSSIPTYEAFILDACCSIFVDNKGLSQVYTWMHQMMNGCWRTSWWWWRWWWWWSWWWWWWVMTDDDDDDL